MYMRKLTHLAAMVCAVLLAIVPILPRADTGLGDGLRPDVRLLIDISGSMKTSDPENLRAPAVELIVRLLPKGSKAGVWVFGESVEVLVPHRVIDDEWREEAQRAVALIDNSGQLTNIPGALEAALYDIDRLDSGYRTSIILLTDGKVDVSESPMINAMAARTLLADAAPRVGALGIPIHTIALSEEADWSFVQSLAKITNGIAEKVDTAEQLTEVFYQSLEMVAPTSRVPLSRRKFLIDATVREFTVLAFFDNNDPVFGLVGPDGRAYKADELVDGVDWFQNREFSLVTVTEPQPGSWELVAPESYKNRVSVIADLLLEVDPLPNSLPAGKRAELGIRLREHGKVITDPQLLSVFSLMVEITGPGGKKHSVDVLSNYAVPQDGEFRVYIPGLEMPGRYKVTAQLAGETLRRELPMYVEVMASATSSAISTRSKPPLEDDFEAPMIVFGVALVLVILVVSWLLHRRKRRKLEVWRRRNLEMNNEKYTTGTLNPAVSGMTAETDTKQTDS
jgi:von Willebrand factor type A domain-containing protein